MKEQEIRNREAFVHYLRLVREDIANYFPDSEQFRTAPCPACGALEHTAEFAKAGFEYVACRACSTLFVNPRPAAAPLREFYLRSPSSRYWVEGFFLPVAEARREKIFRPRARQIAGQLPALARETIGDIGAGFGLFLEELRILWPHARMIAIEPSAEMAAICRSKAIEVLETTVEDLEGQESRFGLLTAFELLEHLYQPRALVEKAWRLLRPGGRLLATTLNGQGFDIQVLWEQSKSVFPPHHLNFLNPRALAGLCESAGFVVEEVSTPGQLDWDIVEGAIANDSATTDRIWRLLARNGSERCKREFQAWLSRHGLSSHMRILARKP
ncbi:MAG: class I SAM-dependent methyltransferase [Acidobacteria bacterium]|nr:class I SAM-dependent methyltransferase [Acidobacteriota bacterium]